MNALTKLLAVVVAITKWVVIRPSALFAPTCDVAGDANRRTLWRGIDSNISLRKLDPAWNYVTSRVRIKKYAA